MCQVAFLIFFTRVVVRVLSLGQVRSEGEERLLENNFSNLVLRLLTIRILKHSLVYVFN